ncbi:hypothetical protein [Nocardia sp. CC227C]|uniref:hypothetical protein n=1 Tax=Nocardia sp. CC227C TaxID=3044562 RepID=UPI00278BBA3B|nr:hypothetical protein [Nocardia sp. CC227C]
MDYTLSELLAMAAHSEPGTPFTVDQAHEAMRIHRECAVYHCPRKTAAFEALIEAGRIVPDSSRRY